MRGRVKGGKGPDFMLKGTRGGSELQMIGKKGEEGGLELGDSGIRALKRGRESKEWLGDKEFVEMNRLGRRCEGRAGGGGREIRGRTNRRVRV